MTKNTQTKKRSKSDYRREEILHRAIELFDRKGFANTSLDDIARDVGMSREGIYYYFGNRKEILLAIIKPAGESLLDSLIKIIQSDADPKVKLLRALKNHLKRFNSDAREMTLTLRDVYVNDIEDVRPHVSPIWRQYLWLWTELIASGQDSGAFTRSGDPKIISFGIIGMCNWMARWYNPRKPISLNEIISTFASLMSFGVMADGDRHATWFVESIAELDSKRQRRAAARRTLPVQESDGS